MVSCNKYINLVEKSNKIIATKISNYPAMLEI